MKERHSGSAVWLKFWRFRVKSFISDFEHAMLPSHKNARDLASVHKAIQLDPNALSQAKKKHFKALKTTQVHLYTLNTAWKWLHQVILEAKNSASSSTMRIQGPTPYIFLHPLPPSAFNVPTEVMAQILAQYVSHWVITEKRRHHSCCF